MIRYWSRPGEGRHRSALKRDPLWVFERTARTDAEVRRRLQVFGRKWQGREPRAVRIFVNHIEACFTYLAFPVAHQRSLKSTNPIERQIEEFRQRLKPMCSFNNARSAERIIYGLIAYVLNQATEDMSNFKFTQYA